MGALACSLSLQKYVTSPGSALILALDFWTGPKEPAREV
jgi:hypothetical protein